jgi:hypothetical protein
MRRFRLTWGIILLFVGCILLLDNMNVFNFLGFSVWNLIWPTFLIAMGVWIIWASSKSGKYLGEKAEFSVPVDDAEKYAVNIKYGAGELTIGSISDADNLLHCVSFGGLAQEVKEQDEQKIINLWSPVYNAPFRFVNRRKWNVDLNDAVPCSLSLTTGACDTRVDLTQTLVQLLDVESGASSTRITLPAHAGFTKVRGSGGASSLSLVVPPEVAAHIVVKGGLYSASINQNRFPRQENYYESPDYATAANKVDIILEMGVGSIAIH